jgi:uncharacterized protein (PEP-CTERM system associated)
MMVFIIFTGTASFAKFVITPGVNLREEYNDNLFLVNSDKENDYITTITPNIKLEYSPNSQLDMSLDYSLDFRFYSRHSEYNDTSIKDSQNINFLVHAKPMNNFFIDVLDNYRRVPVDIRNRTATENVLLNMTESNMFSISPYLTLPLSATFSTTLGYKYGNTWYRSNENADSEYHSAFLALNKKFSSRLNGGIRYEFYSYLTKGEDVSGSVEDYDSHRGTLTIAYQITPDFKVNGEVGESWFDYKSGNNFEVTSWNINTDYNFRITQNTSFGVSYSTSLQDSPISGVYKHRRADIIFRTANILNLTINPYYYVDKYLREDREDRIEGVNMNIAKPLSGKVNVTLQGDWEKQKFLPENEKVQRYGAGCGLDYLMTSRITTGINYRYNNSNSTIDTEDFTNNIVWLLARIVY